jgi:hypothetical protein
MKIVALVTVLLTSACAASAPETTATAATAVSAPEAAARLNAQSMADLGVDIRSLALLFEASPGSYLLRDALINNGSWFLLQNLEKKGLVKVDVVRGLPNGAEPSTEFVVISLTQKGQQVRDALDAR